MKAGAGATTCTRAAGPEQFGPKAAPVVLSTGPALLRPNELLISSNRKLLSSRSLHFRSPELCSDIKSVRSGFRVLTVMGPTPGHPCLHSNLATLPRDRAATGQLPERTVQRVRGAQGDQRAPPALHRTLWPARRLPGVSTGAPCGNAAPEQVSLCSAALSGLSYGSKAAQHARTGVPAGKRTRSSQEACSSYGYSERSKRVRIHLNGRRKVHGEQNAGRSARARSVRSP